MSLNILFIIKQLKIELNLKVQKLILQVIFDKLDKNKKFITLQVNKNGNFKKLVLNLNLLMDKKWTYK